MQCLNLRYTSLNIGFNINIIIFICDDKRILLKLIFVCFPTLFFQRENGFQIYSFFVKKKEITQYKSINAATNDMICFSLFDMNIASNKNIEK